MRKLATIEVIEEVLPIPDSEFIEKVRIRGWWCVAKKGELKPKDFCVFHEVDSFLPVVPQYAFLEKGSKQKKMIVDGIEKLGYRLKTVVLRGQVSQGLALPLTRFPELQGLSKGEDVTGTLGIHLYEPPIPACLSGELRGAFPGYIPKTDEERVQNLLPMLEELRGSHFSVTVKIDGSSMSVYNYQDDFGVCGRKWNLQESEKNTFWRLANKYELRSRMPSGYAIQGECAGEGIQENRHKLKGQDFYVFYVFEIDKHRYLELDEMTAFCKDLGLKTVPVYSEDFVMRHALEDLLVLADGPCPLNPTMLREGLVFRLKGGEHKTSFKVISNEYLIKYGL